MEDFYKTVVLKLVKILFHELELSYMILLKDKGHWKGLLVVVLG